MAQISILPKYYETARLLGRIVPGELKNRSKKLTEHANLPTKFKISVNMARLENVAQLQRELQLNASEESD